MKIGADVFIGDEVYLENEYPECVEIGDGVQISLRAVVLAHTRGAGRVVIEKSAYIGPQVVIACSGTRELRIGAGSVLSAGCMITRDVPSGVLMSVDPPRSVASVTLPLSEAETFQDFVRGLRPIRTQKATPAAEPASDSK
jgi:carbonic anhydrase/acetyltransferase-like protein (isoleucine patch superfamily)